MNRCHQGVMVSVWAVAVAAGIVLGFTGATQANLLSNPSFETAGSGGAADAAVWTEYSNSVHTAARSSTVAHTGAWSFYFDVAPTNTTGVANNANVVQTNLTTGLIPGGLVTLSGWALNPGVNPLVGSTEKIELRIYYVDGSNNSTYITSPAIIDQNTPTDTWTFGSLSGVIPVGTVSLRAQAIFRTDPGNQTTGSAYIDDLTLTVIPEPASFAMLSLGAVALLRRRR